jgi:hypothetical protein
VNADWILLEPVDEHYRAVPRGVPSHTALLTNLANRVQPLIRYDLGDSVTLLDRACECGSPLPSIRVEGRCDDVIALRNASSESVKLLPLAITTVLEDRPGSPLPGRRPHALRLEPGAVEEDARRVPAGAERFLSARACRTRESRSSRPAKTPSAEAAPGHPRCARAREVGQTMIRAQIRTRCRHLRRPRPAFAFRRRRAGRSR